MTVYIDYIFIQNFIMDCLLLLQTQKLARLQLKVTRMILSVVVSSTYICIMVTFKFEFLDSSICKFFLSFTTIYIAFGPKLLNQYMKLLSIYYLITIVNTGACIVISQLIIKNHTQDIWIKTIVYCISTLLTYTYTEKIWKIYKNRIKECTLMYDAILKVGKNSYMYKGFMDTGNTAYCHFISAPVVFAQVISESQIAQMAKEDYSPITVSTISKNSEEKVYEGSLTIGKKTFKVGVIFVNNTLDKNRKYNMILNYEIFEKFLGGMSI